MNFSTLHGRVRVDALQSFRNMLVRGATTAGLALVGACSNSGGETPNSEGPAVQDSGDVGRIIHVEVTSLMPSAFEEVIRLTGVAKARHDVELSAMEPGEVVKLFVDKGERVKKGQALLQIDDRVLRAELAQAESDSVLASELYERQARVWKDNVGTQAELLQRQNQMETANARLRVLRTRLQQTRIQAPFAGIVDARYVDEGEAVTPWMRVMRLIDASGLDIDAGVPERYAADVHVGSVAYVTFDVLPEREFTGVVKFVGGAVDPGNRTFPVEVELDNPEGVIKPEMVANVRVVRHRLEAAIVVPEESLRYTENGFVAFVATEGERGTIAEERHVRVGPSYANQTVIENGLRPGDRLITRGHREVAAGSRIEIATTGISNP